MQLFDAHQSKSAGTVQMGLVHMLQMVHMVKKIYIWLTFQKTKFKLNVFDRVYFSRQYAKTIE